jgi:hypothetical protein
VLFVLGGLTNEVLDDHDAVIQFFKQTGLNLYVRPVPGEQGLPSAHFWRERLAFHDVEATFLDSEIPFDHVLAELRPMLVASWYSTCLVDALYRGFIPVCLARDDDPFILATVFPLTACSLRVDEDLNLLRLLYSDKVLYESQLAKLRLNERIVV